MYINYFRVCNLLQIQGGRMGSRLGREGMWTVESKRPSPETFTYKKMFLATLQEDLPPPGPCQEQKPRLTHMWVMLRLSQTHSHPLPAVKHLILLTFSPTHKC